MNPRTDLAWPPNERCGCHQRPTYPLDIDSVYEALIAPTRAAREAERTNLTWGMCDYAYGPPTPPKSDLWTRAQNWARNTLNRLRNRK